MLLRAIGITAMVEQGLKLSPGPCSGGYYHDFAPSDGVLADLVEKFSRFCANQECDESLRQDLVLRFEISASREYSCL